MFTVRGVSLAQEGRTTLDGLDLHVHAGERVVLLGVNGSGKTTLLKLLNGLLSPSRGTVEFSGDTLDAKHLDDSSFRRRFRSQVVLLFQNVDAMLFNPTAADEIAFGPRQLGLPDIDARVAKWAGVFELESLLDRPPFDLSGGEKKRLALAAIFALEPRVVLLDEPTANLDPATAGKLIDVLHEIPGLTVISSTHNLSLAGELGDRAVLLSREHRIVFDGPPRELLSNEPLLIESGLAHRHVHKHGSTTHAHPHVHYHVHDFD